MSIAISSSRKFSPPSSATDVAAIDSHDGVDATGVIPIPPNVQLTRAIVDVTGTVVETPAGGFALRFAPGEEPIIFGTHVRELPILARHPIYQEQLRELLGQPHHIYGVVDRLEDDSLRVANIYADDPIYIGYRKGELLLETPPERRDEAAQVLQTLGVTGIEWHETWALIRFNEGEEQRFIEAAQEHPELFPSSTLNHWAVIPRGRVTPT